MFVVFASNEVVHVPHIHSKLFRWKGIPHHPKEKRQLERNISKERLVRFSLREIHGQINNLLFMINISCIFCFGNVFCIMTPPALANTEESEVLPREAYNKLPSGVIYADISVGNGEEVKEGSKVNIQWVLRRSNGYFVDSSAVSDSVPFIFTVGDPNGAIAGLDEGIRGMKSGGSRRILIPPRLAYVAGVEDGKPGPIPAGFGPKQQMRRVMEVRRDVPGEYVFLEVKVTRVR